MNVLVTGGAGYIGSHVCKALAKNGFCPVTYDNCSTGHGKAVKWGPLIRGDLNNRDAIESALKEYRPQVVFHFAALALVAESMSDPAKYYRNNTVATLNLLEAMIQYNVPYLIFSGTCAVYGNPQFLPITEDHPLLPINPYGKSKLMIEQMLRDFEDAYGLRSVTLRYFNAAGADREGEIGEEHNPETHLLPSLIQTALNQRTKMELYGTDFDTHDGSAVRDYIHVEDLAEAHLLAMKFLLAGNKSNVFNLGTGRGISILELLQAVQHYCGRELPVQWAPRRKGDPSSLVASAERAKKILGWNPNYSDLQNLIASAWRWHDR